MTERRSRIGLDPPPRFFADVISYLRVAFPQANLGRAEIAKLRSHLVSQWRMGQTAARAAASTCSCDGNQIVPSPATAIDVLPARFRPPLVGADMTFGYEQLREPRAVERARLAAEVAKRQLEHYSGEVSRIDSKLQAQDLGQRARKSLERMRALAERQVARYSALSGDRGRAFQAVNALVESPQVPGRASEPISVFERPESTSASPRPRKKRDESTRQQRTTKSTAVKATSESGQVGDSKRGGKAGRRKSKDSSAPPQPIPSEDLAALQSLIDTFADEEVSALSRKG